MSVVNVNAFQERISYSEYLTSYTDLYMKQALANLGQRTGGKGDGITKGEFNCSVLISDYASEEALSSYYVSVEYDPNSYEVYASLYNPYSNRNIGGQSVKTSLSGTVLTEERIHSVMNASNNYIEAGSYITKNISDNSMSVTALHYNSNTSYVNMFDYTDDGKLNKGVIAFFDDENKLTFKYLYTEGDQYKMNTGDLKDVQYNSIDDVYREFTVYDSNIVDFLNTIEFDEAQDIELTYDSTNSDKIGPKGITTEANLKAIAEFSQAEGYWYPVFVKAYNEVQYFNAANNNGLKKHILANIIKWCYENSDTELVGDERYKVLIPCSKKIIYYVNSNDGIMIYGDAGFIPVDFYNKEVHNFSDSSLNEIDFDNRESIKAQGAVTKTSAISFNVTYLKDDLIDSVFVSKVYTLPYVMNGHWYINDSYTDNVSQGDDAGLANVIILKSVADTNMTSLTRFEMLASAKKEELNQYFMHNDSSSNGTDGVLKTFTYRVPMQADSSSTAALVELQTLLPNLDDIQNDEHMFALIEHALFMSLTPVYNSSIIEDSSNKGINIIPGYKGGYITSLWTIVSKEDGYDYEPVMADGAILDMNTIGNIDQIVKYSMNNEYAPDKYEYQWLVFKVIKSSYKQNTKDEASEVYPVIRNLTANELTVDSDPLTKFGDQQDNAKKIYLNDFNFVIEYKDKVSKNTDGIADVNSTGNRFFTASTLVEPNFTYIKSEDTDYWTKEIIPGSYTYTYTISNVINYKDYSYEVIPNAKYDANGTDEADDVYPMVDLKEVLLRNTNTINRTNIIGIRKVDDENSTVGAMYYGYFGVAYDTADRERLKIGTANIDVNMGQTTLATYIDRFNKFNDFDINIDRIWMNGLTSMTKDGFYNKVLWDAKTISPAENASYATYTAIVQPIDYIDESSKNDDSIFGTIAEVRKPSRYMIAQNADASDCIRNKTYIKLNELFNRMGLSYDGALIYMDDSLKVPGTTAGMYLTTSYLYNPPRYDSYIYSQTSPTYVIANPIIVTYTDALQTTIKYKNDSKTMKYAVQVIEHGYVEKQVCDGCIDGCACADKPEMLEKCKYTYIQLSQLPMSYSATYYMLDSVDGEFNEISAYRLVKDYVNNPDNKGSYLYDAVNKEYSYNYRLAYAKYYKVALDTLPTTYQLPYMINRDASTTEIATDTPEYSYSYYGRIINVREIKTTASTVEFENIQLN